MDTNIDFHRLQSLIGRSLVITDEAQTYKLLPVPGSQLPEGLDYLTLDGIPDPGDMVCNYGPEGPEYFEIASLQPRLDADPDDGYSQFYLVVAANF